MTPVYIMGHAWYGARTHVMIHDVYVCAFDAVANSNNYFYAPTPQYPFSAAEGSHGAIPGNTHDAGREVL